MSEGGSSGGARGRVPPPLHHQDVVAKLNFSSSNDLGTVCQIRTGVSSLGRAHPATPFPPFPLEHDDACRIVYLTQPQWGRSSGECAGRPRAGSPCVVCRALQRHHHRHGPVDAAKDATKDAAGIRMARPEWRQALVSFSQSRTGSQPKPVLMILLARAIHGQLLERALSCSRFRASAFVLPFSCFWFHAPTFVLMH